MFHWICPECGLEIPATARECPACDGQGAEVAAAADLAPQVSEAPATVPPAENPPAAPGPQIAAADSSASAAPSDIAGTARAVTPEEQHAPTTPERTAQFAVPVVEENRATEPVAETALEVLPVAEETVSADPQPEEQTPPVADRVLALPSPSAADQHTAAAIPAPELEIVAHSPQQPEPQHYEPSPLVLAKAEPVDWSASPEPSQPAPAAVLPAESAVEAAPSQTPVVPVSQLEPASVPAVPAAPSEPEADSHEGQHATFVDSTMHYSEEVAYRRDPVEDELHQLAMRLAPRHPAAPPQAPSRGSRPTETVLESSTSVGTASSVMELPGAAEPHLAVAAGPAVVEATVEQAPEPQLVEPAKAIPLAAPAAAMIVAEPDPIAWNGESQEVVSHATLRISLDTIQGLLQPAAPPLATKEEPAETPVQLAAAVEAIELQPVPEPESQGAELDLPVVAQEAQDAAASHVLEDSGPQDPVVEPEPQGLAVPDQEVCAQSAPEDPEASASTSTDELPTEEIAIPTELPLPEPDLRAEPAAFAEQPADLPAPETSAPWGAPLSRTYEDSGRFEVELKSAPVYAEPVESSVAAHLASTEEATILLVEAPAETAAASDSTPAGEPALEVSAEPDSEFLADNSEPFAEIRNPAESFNGSDIVAADLIPVELPVEPAVLNPVEPVIAEPVQAEPVLLQESFETDASVPPLEPSGEPELINIESSAREVALAEPALSEINSAEPDPLEAEPAPEPFASETLVASPLPVREEADAQSLAIAAEPVLLAPGDDFPAADFADQNPYDPFAYRTRPEASNDILSFPESDSAPAASASTAPVDAPPFASFVKATAATRRRLAPIPAGHGLLGEEPEPSFSLPGPMLPPQLDRFLEGTILVGGKQKQPKKASSGTPGWMVTFLVTMTLLTAGVAVLKNKLVPGAETAAAPAKPVSAASPVQQVSHPLSKYLEITGVRVVVDFNKKSQVQYIVVNHSAAEIADVTMHVTVKGDGRTQPICAFSFRLPSLGPFESKELSMPIEKPARGLELPEWQNLRTDFQITAN